MWIPGTEIQLTLSFHSAMLQMPSQEEFHSKDLFFQF